VSGTSVSGVSTLTLQNIGGSASFSGPVNVTTLSVPVTVNDVSLTGTSGTVTNAVTFANTGALALGTAGGTLTFTGGLTAATPSTIMLAGTIASGGAIDLTTTGALAQQGNLSTAGAAVSLAAGGAGITMSPGTTTSTSGGAGSIHYAASGPITLGSLLTGGDVAIDATGGSILALLGVTNITAGGTLSLTALGGTVGTAAAPITVAVTGPANMNATGLLGGVAIAANGTVGSTVPLFPPSVVGGVLWNGVDLNAPLPPPPPVNPPAPTTSTITELNTIGDLNAVIDFNAATQQALVNTVVAGSLAPTLAVVPVIAFDRLSDVNPIIALLSMQNGATSPFTATLMAPLVETPSTWYTETSTETEDAPGRAAVIRPPAGGRSAIQIRDGGIRLPAGLVR
jgi:hypothetical protein